MEKEFITNNNLETKELGKFLALEIRGGEIICLSGNLGSGKTTFTQGFLEGLGAKGPYTSPTFLIMKEYEIKNLEKFEKAYHFDVYRVNSSDVLNLGFEEIIAEDKNTVIIEWAERILDIIPENSLWINFELINENKRRITLKNLPR